MTLPGRKSGASSSMLKEEISSRPPISNYGHEVRTASAVDINNNYEDNRSSFSFNTRLDVPSGFLPPAFKDCILSNVLRSGKRCLDLLKEVRESLSNMVAEDEELSKGVKKEDPSPEILQLSLVAEALCVLTREGFVPMHRLNQAAVGLYVAEDFLRSPADLRAFDVLKSGKIKVPDANFNTETVQKLRDVVDKTTLYYNKFHLKRGKGAEMQDIMLTFMRSFQDMYTLALGCLEVFKVLLYTTSREKINMQDFLLSMSSMERSDMLTEVQDLRRLVDEIVIFLEKLSWGCFVVYRLSRGNDSQPKPKQEEAEETVAEAESCGEDVKHSAGDPKCEKDEVTPMPDEQTFRTRLELVRSRIPASKKKKRKVTQKDDSGDITNSTLTKNKKNAHPKENSAETGRTLDVAVAVKNADTKTEKEQKKKDVVETKKRVSRSSRTETM